MATVVDEARTEALERAVEVGGRHDLPLEERRAFLGRYYRHVPDEDLANSDPVDLAGGALSHRGLAAHRDSGTADVRVFTPTVDQHGWSCGHTVVEIVTDDMPFLVDSVTAELNRRDRSIHLVVHPTFVVRRDAEGNLLEVLDHSASAVATGSRHESWPQDAQVESWIHVEIDRESNAGDVKDITAGMRKVLDDVRAAVEDWRTMRDTAREVADGLGDPPSEDLREDMAEAQRLLRWLADDNFTFLGYREYELSRDSDGDQLATRQGTGLGILRHDQARSSNAYGRLSAPARAKARERTALVLTKANSRSTVHRPTYLDYVGVKTFDADGEVTGERRFLGLLTSAAYTESVRRVPVIDRKVDAVLDRSGFARDSHSGKDLLTILETYPRDELFQTSVDELYETAMAVLHLQERRRTRLFMRRDDYGRFMSCLVFLPRDRYTTKVRLRMEAILREAFDAESVDFTTRVSESVLARLHYVIRVAAGTDIADVDADALQDRLIEATRTWDEDLVDALRAEVGEERAARIARDWSGSIPEAYKEDFTARVAVGDLRRVDELCRTGDGDACAPEADVSSGSGDGADAEERERGTPDRSGSGGAIAMNMYEPVGAEPEERRFKLFRARPLSLTQVLPFFRNLGVEVVDERPYELVRQDGFVAYLYDFGLRYRPEQTASEATRALFTDAFTAAWEGRTESDGLDQLVLGAGLTWRQVVILRAYAKYLRQTGSTFSQDYVERALMAHREITRSLVNLFEARFDPDRADGEAREETTAALVEELDGALDDVESLDQDRILRAFRGMITATLRTSFYQVDGDGLAKPYVALKLDPQRVPDLPDPRPAFEIWVYSPRVEGVHLRFGAVARGGLRWSDRREDFRTEILGLVKAQMVKNAVIVPTGAKGGFVGKRLPDASDREAFQAEGVACYTTFVSALLDVTDNLILDDGTRTVAPPERVVRHDGDDTYLVVAADKGTASFSDTANAVATDYGFWLGDAFASGGSVGYDHKAIGITARGAWESVKRHFREMDVDTQTQDFTVVGVGDMSGDVFGNGMLLSEHIRLVAAFDHRHVFLDPDPDPETSYAERKRLFELGRSSWGDYDTSLISAGGGVHARSAKSVPISSQVASALGLPEGTKRMTPAELQRAILAAPVDLLWNGGIGTYVKASSETQAAAGDKANDGIRLDGRDLRAKVVGEGGNLGLTQRGRIEAAQHGVRVNTDAIDNSAGVDCSDHEVNIKIALDEVVAEGELTTKQRSSLLAEMTDDVAWLVLRDNYEQNVLLGNARKQGVGMMSVHQRFIRSLEASGELARELEALPSDGEIAERIEAGHGLTSPEFSVLVAYAKMTLTDAVLATALPDEPWFERSLRGYFPEQLVERYSDRLSGHPLRRQIITTTVVNDLVNRGGTTFAYRAMEETGAAADQVVRAYVVAREVFDLRSYVAAVEALDTTVGTGVQTELYLEFRRLLDRAVRWFLQNRRDDVDTGEEIDQFDSTVATWRGRMADALGGKELERLRARADDLTGKGVPEELALRYSGLLDEFSLLDVVDIAATTQASAQDVLPLYFSLSERYQVDSLLGRIGELGRTNRWEALARGALRDDLYSVLEMLTRSVLDTTEDTEPEQRIEQWEKANASQLSRVQQTIDDVRRLDHAGLASLQVVLRLLRGVIRSGSGA